MEADFEELACSVLRALRGRRSQTVLSRMLGYRTNVVYRWEAGVRWPTAATWFQLLSRIGAPVSDALNALGPGLAQLHDEAELGTPEHQVLLLNAICVEPANEVAALTELPAYSVRRLLRGATQPTLPVFFRIVEAVTGRLAPFLESLVAPEALTALGASYQISLAQRAVYQQHPWAEAILAKVECADYLSLRFHSNRWLADRMGIPEREVDATIQALVQAGGLKMEGQLYRTQPIRTTHLTAAEAQLLRHHWAQQIFELDGTRARTAYIVFSCTDDGLAELRQVLGQAFADIRGILDRQEDPTRAMLMTTSLAALDHYPLPK